MSVRPAQPGDARAIARVQVASWEATYRGLVPDALIERLTVEVRTAQWERFFTGDRDTHCLLVAEADGTIVGMAAAGPSGDADAVPGRTGSISAIYVDPGSWSQGHGRALMVAALRWLEGRGFEEATLWVLGTNRRGRAFYQAGGWRTDGATQDDDSFGEVLAEVRYRIDLSR